MFEVMDESSMSMLVDMEGFKLEAPSAWRADFNFGQELRNNVERMAIVGDRWWETWKVFPHLRQGGRVGLAERRKSASSLASALF